MEKPKIKRKTKNQFKVGNKSSVGYGRTPMTEEEKSLSLKNRTQLKNIINKYMISTKAELKALSIAKKTPMLDRMLLKSLINAEKSGNQQQIDWFINHTVGKEKDETNIRLSGAIESTTSFNLKKMSKEDLLLLKEISERNSCG